jgi:hypothetical protein
MLALRVATCLTLPEPDLDEAPLAEALASAGVAARLCAWDDPAEPWDSPVPTLLRSTWNYALSPDAFAAWIRRVGAAAALWNPVDVVLGNLSKRYLLELPERGVAAVPTRWCERGEVVDLTSCLRELSAERLVAKPAIGAGSLDTERFARGDDERFAAHLARLTRRGAALVQPYVDSVHDYGERSLVWIDGELSHAVRKTPRFSGDVEHVDGPLPWRDDEVDLATRALRPFAGRVLYARVDLARDREDRPMVMELELIEPSLFFAKRPGSAQRLVAALLRRMAGSP